MKVKMKNWGLGLKGLICENNFFCISY